jgi:hypothetical protein
VVLFALLGAGAWYFTREPAKPVVVEAPKPVPGPGPEVTPPPVVVPPLVVRIESEPAGAAIQLAGVSVGQTLFEARVEKVKLPVALRLSADGYEPAEATLTDMTGPSLSLVLKKKAPAVKTNPGGTGKNPDIKTTR